MFTACLPPFLFYFLLYTKSSNSQIEIRQSSLSCIHHKQIQSVWGEDMVQGPWHCNPSTTKSYHLIITDIVDLHQWISAHCKTWTGIKTSKQEKTQTNNCWTIYLWLTIAIFLSNFALHLLTHLQCNMTPGRRAPLKGRVLSIISPLITFFFYSHQFYIWFINKPKHGS